MLRTREDLVAAAKDRGLRVTETTHAFEIELSVRPNFAATIVVPKEVTEWFLSFRDAASGRELFSDWCEHYSTKEAPLSDAQAVEEMVESVLALLGVFETRECRVGANVVEALTKDGIWRNVWDLV